MVKARYYPPADRTVQWHGEGAAAPGAGRPHRHPTFQDHAAVARNNTIIAAYATRGDRPDFPFWPMLFDNMTIRLCGSDDFPADAKQQAATDLTTAAASGAVSISISPPLPLEQAAEAHDQVDSRHPEADPPHPPGLSSWPGSIRVWRCTRASA